MHKDFLDLSHCFSAQRSTVRVPDLDPKYKISVLASKQVCVDFIIAYGNSVDAEKLLRLRYQIPSYICMFHHVLCFGKYLSSSPSRTIACSICCIDGEKAGFQLLLIVS